MRKPLLASALCLAAASSFAAPPGLEEAQDRLKIVVAGARESVHPSASAVAALVRRVQERGVLYGTSRPFLPHPLAWDGYSRYSYLQSGEVKSLSVRLADGRVIGANLIGVTRQDGRFAPAYLEAWRQDARRPEPWSLEDDVRTEDSYRADLEGNVFLREHSSSTGHGLPGHGNYVVKARMVEDFEGRKDAITRALGASSLEALAAKAAAAKGGLSNRWRTGALEPYFDHAYEEGSAEARIEGGFLLVGWEKTVRDRRSQGESEAGRELSETLRLAYSLADRRVEDVTDYAIRDYEDSARLGAPDARESADFAELVRALTR